MCIYYPDTRWRHGCHQDGCKMSIYKKSPPFVKLCSTFDDVTGQCLEVPAADITTSFDKTLDCPTHHESRMANLQEVWDTKWTEIAQLDTDSSYR